MCSIMEQPLRSESQGVVRHVIRLSPISGLMCGISHLTKVVCYARGGCCGEVVVTGSNAPALYSVSIV